MQHSTFTLADKMQYVTNVLGHVHISVADCEDRLFAALESTIPDWGPADRYKLERWFGQLRERLRAVDQAVYRVLDATDSKQAIAAVKQLKTGSAKLNY